MTLFLKNEIRWYSSYYFKEVLHCYEWCNRFTIENGAFCREHVINITLFAEQRMATIKMLLTGKSYGKTVKGGGNVGLLLGSLYLKH